MKRILEKVLISGREVWPIIEGGKGVAVSTGASAGAFAAADAVGTFSATQADVVDDNGNFVPLVFKGNTRAERHEEYVDYSIRGGISQARIAFEKSKGLGRIHMNMLWEIGGAMRILNGILSGTKGLIHGITCGAGMPYGLAAVAMEYNVYYYPIISSARVFKVLWQRAYHKHASLLGGVVYEDPWLAGGHNGISNRENPDCPEDPYSRVAEIRTVMNDVGLSEVPIIMAGGVWALKEWTRFIDSKDVGKVAFQFGTRAILTQESSVPDAWKQKLLSMKEGDIRLNTFSPTGLHSSAVTNNFLTALQQRSERQAPFQSEAAEGLLALEYGSHGRFVYMTKEDHGRALRWMADGYSKMVKTPSDTVVFLTPEEWEGIRADQIDCKGCLSRCRFSNWMDSAESNHNTGAIPDPRSFCIQKTLVSIAHGGNIENELMFSGHCAYRFATDPLYADNNIPTVQQLVNTILVGD